jgi:hypothetical protein
MAKAKSKKKAVPKAVAGVKVPKTVRKWGSLNSLITSDLGREILADALIAAATAAAAALTRTRTAKATGNAMVDAGSDAASATKDATQTAAGAVAGVITDAARNLLPPSLVGDTGPGPEDKSQRPRYAHRSSDLSSRKRSKKEEKGGKKGNR